LNNKDKSLQLVMDEKGEQTNQDYFWTELITLLKIDIENGRFVFFYLSVCF